MGDPKFSRKHFATPSHPWDGVRIAEENQIIHKYGLKNKRELWKSETILRDIRGQARELQARLRSSDEQAIKERDVLIERLKRLGLLSAKADLNDVLALEVEALLARRLQTQIYLKGLARSVKQARQLIVHGHIAVDGRKVTVPSYLVTDTEQALIDYYVRSPFVSELHPERPAADFSPDITTVKEERRVAGERERDMRRARDLERIAAMRKAIEGEDAVEEDLDEEDVVDLDEAEEEGNGEGEAPKGKSEDAPKGKPEDTLKGKPKEGDKPQGGDKPKDRAKVDKGGDA